MPTKVSLGPCLLLRITRHVRDIPGAPVCARVPHALCACVSSWACIPESPPQSKKHTNHNQCRKAHRNSIKHNNKNPPTSCCMRGRRVCYCWCWKRRYRDPRTFFFFVRAGESMHCFNLKHNCGGGQQRKQRKQRKVVICLFLISAYSSFPYP